MYKTSNFFAAPTEEQKLQFQLLADRGLSSSSYVCYVQTGVYALSKTFVTILIESISTPSKNLGDMVVALFDGNLSAAANSSLQAVAIGARSLLQIAILTMAVVAGYFAPHKVYTFLRDVNQLESKSNAELSALCDDLKDNKKKLKEEKKALEKKAGSLQSDMDRCQQEWQVKLEEAIAKKEETIAQFSQAKQMWENEANTLQNRLKDQEIELNTQVDKLEELRGKLIQQQIAKEAEIRAKAGISEAQKTIHKLENQIQTCQNKLVDKTKRQKKTLADARKVHLAWEEAIANVSKLKKENLELQTLLKNSQ